MNFTCLHCGRTVPSLAPGTQHRNHCPFCLYSQHLDQDTPGDRKADCGGIMAPVGLSFKDEGGKKVGEICLVHKCLTCGVFSKNRIAGDDDPQTVENIFHASFTDKTPFTLLDTSDSLEVYTQLYGRSKALEMVK